MQNTGCKTDSGNCRGIALLNTVGKVFYELLNDRVVGILEREEGLVRVNQDADAKRVVYIMWGSGLDGV